MRLPQVNVGRSEMGLTANLVHGLTEASQFVLQTPAVSFDFSDRSYPGLELTAAVALLTRGLEKAARGRRVTARRWRFDQHVARSARAWCPSRSPDGETGGPNDAFRAAVKLI